MEDAGRDLRTLAERGAQHLQRLAVRHEDERLVSRIAPARRLRRQPLEARVAGVHGVGLLTKRAVVGSERSGECGPRRQRATHAIDLLPPRDRMWSRHDSRTAVSTASRSCHFDGGSIAIGRPTRGGRPPMSARRVELVHGGRGVPSREARLEAHVLGKLVGTKQLQQAEEPVCIVFERRGAQEQDVTAQARDRCDRSPGGVARVAGRAAESLCLVHDEQVDAGAYGLVGQLRPLRQHLQGDHGTTMNVEGVEVGTEIARHVGEALRIEQREHLVVLAPELTEPLNGQDIGCDDETALDLPGVHEPIQDERGLDRLSRGPLRRRAASAPDRWRSRVPRRGAGAETGGRVRRGTNPGRQLREAPGGAGCPGG